ncbi:SpoIIE family protein phosphatase [Streptomyces sp. NPDC002004]
MGPIPMQREIAVRPAAPPAGRPDVRMSLPGNSLAPAAARRFVRDVLDGWAGLSGPVGDLVGDRLVEDAVVVVSELVTNAVVHAGTDVGLACRMEPVEADAGDTDRDDGALVVEVSDQHPGRGLDGGAPAPPQGTGEYGRGLQLVSALATAWGVTYRAGTKTVWARLPARGARPEREPGAYGGRGERVAYPGADGGAPERGTAPSADGGAEPYAGERPPARTLRVAAPASRPAHDQDADGDLGWVSRGALSFLAEASDLLAGQLDEDLVAALTGQLLVPRLADWCAVWLGDEADRAVAEADGTGDPGAGVSPARVWHRNEQLIEELRRALEKEPPRLPDVPRTGPVPVPWPAAALSTDGTALAFRLVAGGRPLGTLVIGRAGLTRFPDEVTGLVEDFSRRVALAIGAARQYARQATISRVLQRGLLPSAVAEIPGVQRALVYEPREKGGPGGDFYDVFPAADGRWCFALGDVQGKGPEAAVVIGLARPWLRLLAREGYEVAEVLDRLNQMLLDDATEAADAAARAIAAVGSPELPPEGSLPRFLSLLYGELVPTEDGVRCTLASAGHPLPLLLRPDGDVLTAAVPQVLLGVVEDATYRSETFHLHEGDTLLCVTDGVTERRCGQRQFDDGDGLAAALAGCTGMSASLVAERIRRLVHEFAPGPPEDDLALLVLQAQHRARTEQPAP